MSNDPSDGDYEQQAFAELAAASSASSPQAKRQHLDRAAEFALLDEQRRAQEDARD